VTVVGPKYVPQRGPCGSVEIENRKGTLTGHLHTRINGLTVTAPDGKPWEAYLKVERRGDELRSYISSDGQEWSPLSRDEPRTTPRPRTGSPGR
jgi:hypothetical protein